MALHPEVIYRWLFQCAWTTLQAFGGNPRRLGGQLGMSTLLHTWGQTLTRHPHLHCLVPGGALSPNGEWHPAKGHYLFPVRALSRGFRGRMVKALRAAFEAGELPRVTDAGEPARTLDALMQTERVVYCRPGIQHPESVIRYLGRYIHLKRGKEKIQNPAEAGGFADPKFETLDISLETFPNSNVCQRIDYSLIGSQSLRAKESEAKARSTRQR